MRERGVANNWVWWAFLLTGMSTVFFYARMWRRSGVLTDLEFYEIRYSGKPAAMVRAFRAVYLGLFFNIVIMATVNLAAAKIANVLLGWPMWQTLARVRGDQRRVRVDRRAVGRADHRRLPVRDRDDRVGRRGVFALQQPQVGGLSGLMAQIPPSTLQLLPDFNDWPLTLSVLILPLTISWWSVWYPGSEPGGGSYIAQRILASKSERDALGGTLFFNVAHYALRPWPWIIVALASMLVYPAARRHRARVPVSRSRADRPRHGLSGDAGVPAVRLPRPDGRGPAGRVRLDDLDASQLGHVVSRARSLSPLHSHRRRRAALRDDGPPRHRRC